jgi:hypothetical protein
MTLRRHAQHNGELLRALLIISVARVAAQISIVQRIGHHPDVRLILIHRPIITTVTVSAEVVTGMNDVPLTFIRNWISLSVTGEARRWRRIRTP